MPSSSDGPIDDGPSLYELLQLSPSADAQELRLAFRRLSKRYHPDTTVLPADQAQEAFRRLQQAYAVLSDPLARRAYDSRRLAALHLAGSRPAQPPPRLGEPRPVPVRRALSGGEWFALLLLALALVLSLVLGIGVAWARGAELVRQPSWWPPAGPGNAAGADNNLMSTPLAKPLTKPASTALAMPPSTALPDTRPLATAVSAAPATTAAAAPSGRVSAAAIAPSAPLARTAAAAPAAAATAGLPPSPSLPKRP